MTDRFDVWIWFPADWHDRVGQGLDAKAAVETAVDYTRRPAAMCGIIRRVTIVDEEDYTVFEWRYGEGVVFPRVGFPPEAAA